MDEILQAQREQPIEFFADLLSSLKSLIRYDFERYAMEHRAQTGETVRAYIPTIMGYRSDRELETRRSVLTDCLEQQPHILASAQYNDFLAQPTLTRLSSCGSWGVLPRAPRHGIFRELGLDDAFPQFYTFAMQPFVFLIDRRNIGSLPVPHTWEELLRPCYRKKLCLNGTKYGPDIYILLYLYRRFGMAGIDALVENTLSQMHGSAMARNIGTSKNGGAAVYVSTAFFAYCHGEDKNTQIVWPRDGAAAQPFCMLVQRGYEDAYRWITDYITGPRMGRLLNDNWIIPTNAQACTLPERDYPLGWAGWALMGDRRTPDIVAEMRGKFTAALEERA